MRDSEWKPVVIANDSTTSLSFYFSLTSNYTQWIWYGSINTQVNVDSILDFQNLCQFSSELTKVGATLYI